MRKLPPVALVCAGPVSRSGLDRLPGIREHLRWVKSGTMSAATRAVNVLGCGYAVRDFGELAGAGIILVKAPDEKLRRLLEEMLESDLDWRLRTVILIDSQLDSLSCPELEDSGAWIASVNQLDWPGRTLLLEGHTEAVRMLRHMARARRVPVIELRRGGKTRYLEGMRLATSAFVPTVAAAVESFREAGMEKAAAERTAAMLFADSVRAYCRAGKRLLNKVKRES